jgi:arylsulfatase B
MTRHGAGQQARTTAFLPQKNIATPFIIQSRFQPHASTEKMKTESLNRMKMNQTALNTTLAILAFAIATMGLPENKLAAAPPNVVIVITDDQGYGDLSCHGNPILKTPNLDDLYADSVRLKDYHVAPTCSPTRSGFLTGHWTNRTGVWHTIMGRSMLRENEVTMGQIFKDNGYATGMFGKWHLGDNYPYRPEDRGYTEVMRHGGGGVGQTPDYWDNAYFDGSYWHNGKPEKVKGFCTDVFFDYAKTFVREQKAKKQPFLAYIATNAPHGPMHSPEESSKPYQDQNVNLANFFGMIANIDDNVGAFREFLDEEGLSENTIFIFTTDNGSSSGSNVFNAEMRGKKGSQYDGGHRVPLFLHWEKSGLDGGYDVEPLTSYVDVVPTLIELCDLTPPKGVKFDGVSIVPLLKGNTSGNWSDRMMITDSQRVKDPIKWKSSAVMTSNWRLIDGQELFQIKNDPGQTKNIASQHPDVVNRMRNFYESWWSELEPTFSNATAIYLGHPADNPARLTSHDWITSGSTPWNQSHIRKAVNGDRNTGFWNVYVHEAGQYEVRLRRWPEEANLAINASLPPGADVPGVKAYRTSAGQAINPSQASLSIAEIEMETEVKPGDHEAVFNLELPKGKTRMLALFHGAKGQEHGAYYVYVTKK